eukprot:scaffold30424_cov27-Prasinocladus_malaysianus.AAC.1
MIKANVPFILIKLTITKSSRYSHTSALGPSQSVAACQADRQRTSSRTPGIQAKNLRIQISSAA